MAKVKQLQTWPHIYACVHVYENLWICQQNIQVQLRFQIVLSQSTIVVLPIRTLWWRVVCYIASCWDRGFCHMMESWYLYPFLWILRDTLHILIKSKHSVLSFFFNFRELKPSIQDYSHQDSMFGVGTGNEMLVRIQTYTCSTFIFHHFHKWRSFYNYLRNEFFLGSWEWIGARDK